MRPQPFDSEAGPVPDQAGWERAWAEHVAVCEELKATRAALDQVRRGESFWKEQTEVRERGLQAREAELAEARAMDASADKDIDTLDSAVQRMGREWKADRAQLLADNAALFALLLWAHDQAKGNLPERWWAAVDAPHPGAELLDDVAKAKEVLGEIDCCGPGPRNGGPHGLGCPVGDALAALAKWVRP